MEATERGWKGVLEGLLMLLISLLAFIVRIGILVEVDRVKVSAERFMLKSKGRWFKAGGQMIFRPDQIRYKWRKAKGLTYPVIIKPDKGLLRINDRPYPGEILIRRGRLGLVVINYVDLEDYLISVVKSEIGSLGPELVEALKAQTVAARTYCIKHLKKHKSLGFDLISSIEDQVYTGHMVDSVIEKAVESTRGKILVFNGKPIDAKYHSTCGGLTAPASDVWPVGDVPYLRSINDKGFCKDSPHYRWKRSYFLGHFYQILRRLIKKEIRGPIKLKIKRSPVSKRLIRVTVIDGGVHNEIAGYRFRKGFNLKSTLFDLRVRSDSVIFLGRGWGHGVGMCQWGAIGMARAGNDYKSILNHYYPHAKLARMR